MTRRTWLALSAAPLLAQAAPEYSDHADLLYYLDPSGERRPVRSETDWAIRRSHVLAGMERAMGPFPAGPRPPLNVRVLGETRHDGYVQRSILYDARAEDAVPAYLLIPDGVGKRPAVLALHPTGVLGKGIAVGLGKRPNRDYGRELARRGYVVLAPDYPTMGDPQRDAYELGYASATMKAIYNHSRGVDLLLSLEQVAADRIGAIGHSLGGHNSLYAAAFDERIRAVVTSCGFNAFAKYYGGDLTGWSSHKYMPRIAERYGKSPDRMPFDFTEVLGAMAPRPLFINAPLHDANFEVSGVEDCLRAARPVYERIFNAAERLVAEHPDCDHDFPPDVRERAYGFLDRALGTG